MYFSVRRPLSSKLAAPKAASFVLARLGKTYSYLAAMTTYYFRNPEEALKRAKAAGKHPGYWWCGITLPSGKKGWAIYRDGKDVERHAVKAVVYLIFRIFVST